jgi:hypothetical protein
MHNAIVAVTNGGTSATDALLTLHYDNGQKKYEIQQTIKPGDQMWLNFADLIHHSVPDRNGQVLPADLTSGTYDLEDLSPGTAGNLIEGKVVVDKTWGHLTYGCLTCCGYTSYLDPDPLGLGVGGNGLISTMGTNNCTAADVNLESMFSGATWGSLNASIAQVTAHNGLGMAQGTTNGYARATVPDGDGSGFKVCPKNVQQPGNQVQVTCAVPTNYQGSCSDAGNGVLGCQYTWQANTGNLANLSACVVREYVTYPGTSPFNWKSPPYVGTQTTWPVTLGGPATTGSSPDTHGHPNFVRPYTADTFTATQYYQYICPCANGGQPVNMMGPLSITRSVYFLSPSGNWEYTITKSGSSASTLLP